MSLTGVPLLILVSTGAVLLPVVIVLTWGHRTGRKTRTAVALVLSQLLVTTALGLAVNRQQSFFASWSDLFGKSAGSTRNLPVAAGRSDDAVLAATRRSTGAHGGGVILPMTIHGRVSGLTQPVQVYLPAAYSRPGGRALRFPVIEVLAGFPGSPRSWLGGHLNLRAVLDEEIAARRMAPTIVVLPVQNLSRWRDSECVDAVRGAKLATFLTTDLQESLRREFRVAVDRHGWGLIGYSTGGYCAVNLALQHSNGYAAAASLSGYFRPIVDAATGDLYRGDRTARRDNDPLWLVQHRRLPGLAFYLACASADRAGVAELRTFAARTRLPVETTVVVVPNGGHNFTTWRQLEAPAFDWLSARLTPPLSGPEVSGSNHRSSVLATPSSSFEPTTSSAAARTSG